MSIRAIVILVVFFLFAGCSEGEIVENLQVRGKLDEMAEALAIGDAFLPEEIAAPLTPVGAPPSAGAADRPLGPVEKDGAGRPERAIENPMAAAASFLRTNAVAEGAPGAGSARCVREVFSVLPGLYGEDGRDVGERFESYTVRAVPGEDCADEAPAAATSFLYNETSIEYEFRHRDLPGGDLLVDHGKQVRTGTYFTVLTVEENEQTRSLFSNEVEGLTLVAPDFLAQNPRPGDAGGLAEVRVWSRSEYVVEWLLYRETTGTLRSGRLDGEGVVAFSAADRFELTVGERGPFVIDFSNLGPVDFSDDSAARSFAVSLEKLIAAADPEESPEFARLQVWWTGERLVVETGVAREKILPVVSAACPTDRAGEDGCGEKTTGHTTLKILSTAEYPLSGENAPISGEGRLAEYTPETRRILEESGVEARVVSVSPLSRETRRWFKNARREEVKLVVESFELDGKERSGGLPLAVRVGGDARLAEKEFLSAVTDGARLAVAGRVEGPLGWLVLEERVTGALAMPTADEPGRGPDFDDGDAAFQTDPPSCFDPAGGEPSARDGCFGEAFRVSGRLTSFAAEGGDGTSGDGAATLFLVGLTVRRASSPVPRVPEYDDDGLPAPRPGDSSPDLDCGVDPAALYFPPRAEIEKPLLFGLR